MGFLDSLFGGSSDTGATPAAAPSQDMSQSAPASPADPSQSSPDFFDKVTSWANSPAGQGFIYGLVSTPGHQSGAALGNAMRSSQYAQDMAVQRAQTQAQTAGVNADTQNRYLNNLLTGQTLRYYGLDPSTGRPLSGPSPSAAPGAPMTGMAGPSTTGLLAGSQPQTNTSPVDGMPTGMLGGSQQGSAPPPTQGLLSQGQSQLQSPISNMSPPALIQRGMAMMQGLPGGAQAGASMVEQGMKLLQSGMQVAPDGQSVTAIPGFNSTLYNKSMADSCGTEAGKIPGEAMLQDNQGNQQRQTDAARIGLEGSQKVIDGVTYRDPTSGKMVTGPMSLGNFLGTGGGLPQGAPSAPVTGLLGGNSQPQGETGLLSNPGAAATLSNAAAPAGMRPPMMPPNGGGLTPAQGPAGQPQVQVVGKPVYTPQETAEANETGKNIADAKKGVAAIDSRIGNAKAIIGSMMQLADQVPYGPHFEDRLAALNAVKDPSAQATYDFQNKNSNLFTQELPGIIQNSGGRVDIPLVNAIKDASAVPMDADPAAKKQVLQNLSNMLEKAQQNAHGNLSALTGQPSYYDGQTASNSKTGDRLVYRGGQWTPLK